MELSATGLGFLLSPPRPTLLLRSMVPVKFPRGSKKDLGCGHEGEKGRNHSKTDVSLEGWKGGKVRRQEAWMTDFCKVWLTSGMLACLY